MEKGRRGLHYLREPGVGVSYVVDVYRSSSALPAGGEAGGVTDEMAAVARGSLAGELLPGTCAFDPRRVRLSIAVGNAVAISGYSAVLPKLLPLAACADPEVRAAACAALAEHAFIGRQCRAGETGTGEGRGQSEARRAALERRFRARFLANPLGTAKEYAVLDGREGVADFLRLLEGHGDREVAAAAGRVFWRLRNESPGDEE
jgi:hypothetical protein